MLDKFHRQEENAQQQQQQPIQEQQQPSQQQPPQQPRQQQRPPAQQPPAQQPPVQQPLAQRPTAQQPPVQQPPAQRVPAQRPPAQQPPVQQPAAQQAPAQQPPVQQPPAQRPPAQRSPVQRPAAQQAPVQQPPVQQPPAQRLPAQQPPVQRLAAQQAPAQQPPVQQPAAAQRPPAQQPAAQQPRVQEPPVQQSPPLQQEGTAQGVQAPVFNRYHIQFFGEEGLSQPSTSQGIRQRPVQIVPELFEDLPPGPPESNETSESGYQDHEFQQFIIANHPSASYQTPNQVLQTVRRLYPYNVAQHFLSNSEPISPAQFYQTLDEEDEIDRTPMRARRTVHVLRQQLIRLLNLQKRQAELTRSYLVHMVEETPLSPPPSPGLYFEEEDKPYALEEDVVCADYLWKSAHRSQ